MVYTLQQLAECAGAELSGAADCRIHGVASLRLARSGEIAFLASRRHADYLPATRASAVILRRKHLADCPTEALVSEDPYLAYARIANLFHAPPALEHGIASSAELGAGCVLDEPLQLGRGVCIGPRARLGAGCQVEEHCVIGAGARLGPDCRLGPGVTVCPGARLGARAVIQAGAVIGSRGFGMAWTGRDWLAVPQLGSVVIGDDVEIGANTTIDRGALEDTVIEDGVKIDNQVQIAHNVQVGEHTAIAACCGIAGSARIGRRCRIGGAVGISGHLTISDDVTIMAMSGVAKSIDKPGVYASGLPLMEAREWRRAVLRLPQLDAMARTLRKLG